MFDIGGWVLGLLGDVNVFRFPIWVRPIVFFFTRREFLIMR